MEMAVRSESSMRPKISHMGVGRMDYTGMVATTAMAHHPTGLESCWCLQSILMARLMDTSKSHGIWG